ncbi:penicillin acylase family protein [Gordonia sp. NPDC003429]
MTLTAHTDEIIRDGWGIPHIRAGSAAAALFGQGRACGLDRAWQIEFMRLRAEGRTAEAFGGYTLGWDRFARRAQIDRAARRVLAASSPRTRRLVGAYADGVNSTLAQATAVEFDALGHRPAPWQPWTPISVFIMHNILFGRFTTKLWRAHVCAALGPDGLSLFNFEGPDLASDAPAPPTPEFIDDVVARLARTPDSGEPVGAGAVPDSTVGGGLSGSNAWGVAAARSASGSPLIAGDPHRFLELPGVYLQSHLSCPDFDVAGFAFAGVPGLPHFCHNGSVAWGITNGMGDNQDLYLEELCRVDDAVAVRTPSGFDTAPTRHEEIAVRDADPVTVEIVDTPNGTVVFGGADEGFALSLRTPMLSDSDITFDAPLDLLYADTTTDVVAALCSWSEPVNRIVIGDADGTVTHHVIGAMPCRAAENYWLPVPGWEPRHRWDGYAQPDPGFDPTVDTYSVIANQRISNCLALQPVSTECVAPHRAHRIDELLRTTAPVSVDDCERISRDVRLDSAETILDVLDTLTGLSAGGAAVRDRLSGWDRQMAADSSDAYLFAEVRSRFVAALTRHPAFSALAQPHPFGPVFDPWFVPQPRMAAALDAVMRHAPAFGVDVAAVLRDAVESTGELIDDATALPSWSQVHTLAPVHGFDLVGATARHPELSRAVRPDPLPLAGDAECVFANAAAVGFGVHTCNLGSTARYVWDLDTRDHSRWIVPLGADGAPGTPHFQDQAPLWAVGGYVDVVTDWTRIRDTASSVHTFTFTEEIA